VTLLSKLSKFAAVVLSMIAIWGAGHEKSTSVVTQGEAPVLSAASRQTRLSVGKLASNFIALRQPRVGRRGAAVGNSKAGAVAKANGPNKGARSTESQEIQTQLMARARNRLSGRSGAAPNSVGDFLITAYTNSPSDTGKRPGNPNYGVTASGAPTVAGTTIAADWNVLPEGTVVEIQGLPGTYTVEDTGSGIAGHHIDLFMTTERQAINWGRTYRQVVVLQWGH
jgi:3D (Asp-Asp-Asp) domain-containing protein